MTQQQRGDVVDLLLDQHRAIRELCEQVATATAAEREQPFRSLVRLLAVHEAVEEELVHPYVKRRVEGAKDAVAERVEEEREVNRMLAALDSLGPTNPGFEELFTRFRTALLAHAGKEESSEFAGLRAATKPAERAAMAAALRLASSLAPTHPHPGNESAPRALLVGTPMAMIDRARDLLRDALAGRSKADPEGDSSA
ncbi:hemerythrin domain-containing protein [Blastococcus sp. CT_GayMR19]|jgi:hemerythrin superfamily protein|uniref:hemerythrin domain-containing protein n=1 Tax=Blastococcus sp. CT_GayMR19 TaxID=2559608 RepID=UPI00107344B3|nr:hemerythrin domain-containing protein [Blastococcus sp. CT_GayMR19]TFV77644.1 hemerythrin domain-containing protein [Blastococcus sp. CT_GayMR19]